MTDHHLFVGIGHAAFVPCRQRRRGGEIDGAALAAAQTIECTYDTTSYFSSPEKNTPAFLLVPTVVTKDNLQYLVDTGLYKWDAENKYLEAAK